MLHLDLTVRVLVHRKCVNHTDRVFVMQPLELSDDLAMEVGLAEAQHDQLNGSYGHRQSPLSP
jgi:hypothetical protein